LIVYTKRTRVARSLSLAFHQITIAITLALLVGLFVLAYQHSSGIASRISSLFRTQVSQIKSDMFAASTSIEALYIDVGLKELGALKEQRRAFIKKESYSGEKADENWVKAKLRIGQRSTKAKLRLKGIDPDHWTDASGWSFRVKIQGDENLLGSRRFQLQKVSDLENIMEWALAQELEFEGLIPHHTRFVNAYFNGEPWGAYMIQDHYDKILLERNGFPEGPIIGFDKSDIPAARKIWGEDWQSRLWQPDSFWRAPIAVMQDSKIKSNPQLAELAERGIRLLEGLRTGEKKASDVFDLESTAKTLAVLASMGAAEWDWRDSKFYVNPVTKKLHLISREIHFSPRSIGNWWLPGGDRLKKDQVDFHTIFFSDPVFVSEYLTQLFRISQDFLSDEHIDGLFAESGSEIKQILRNLRSDKSLTDIKKELRDQATLIHYLFNPPTALVAYPNGLETTGIVLDIGSIQELPIEIGCIHEDDEKVACPESKTVLSGKKNGEAVRYSNVVFKLEQKKEELPLADRAITYQVIGSPKILTTKIRSFPISGTSQTSFHASGAVANISDVPWIKVSEKQKTIDLVPGQWQVQNDILFPAGYVIRALGGTTLQLIDGASLVSKSPLDWRGSQTSKIILESPDSTGGGLFVNSASGTSTLDHVIFRQLSSPKRNGAPMRGAITFYESDVTISNSVFDRNVDGDDFINVVRADLIMSDCIFRKSNADAIDIDFGTATFTSLRFEEIGNDAIDISGTSAVAKRLIMDGIGDKALSVGEGSTFEVSESLIVRANIGIAVKDSSRFTGINLGAKSTKVAVAVYRKKPEFGPASAVLIDTRAPDDADNYLTMEPLSGDYLIEKGSQLMINNRLMSTVDRSIIEGILDLDQ